jgi:excisionase family DNA binding protein
VGEFLTLKEASALTGLSLSTLRRAIKSGELVTVPRVNTQHPVRVSREAVTALTGRSRRGIQDDQLVTNSDQLEVERLKAEVERLREKAARDETTILSLGDEVDAWRDDAEALKAARDELLVRVEGAERELRGYREGVKGTLEAFTDDLARRLAEGVQGVQPLDNSDQLVTYSPGETVTNSDKRRRLTLRERLSGRLRAI